MSRIELLDRYLNTSDLYDQNYAFTGADIIDNVSYSKKNNNPFLKKLFTTGVLASTIIFANCEPLNATPIERMETPEGLNKILNDYKEAIFPISSYLKEIKSVFKKGNFTKSEVITKIVSLKTLKSNWDGYGSLPLDVVCTTNSLCFADLLGNDLIEMVDEIYPNPNGTISFEWVNNSYEVLSVEVGNEEMSYFLKMNNLETIYCNEVKISKNETDKISEYIKRL